MKICGIFAALLAALLMAQSPALADDDAYRREVDAWRRGEEAALKADDGWLTLAGLFWVHAGRTTLGSDPMCDIVLPASAPPRVGTLRLAEDGRASLEVPEGVSLTRGGVPFRGGRIESDAGGKKADVLSCGSVRVMLLRRGERHALRVKDNAGPGRRAFSGLRWFPVDPSWKVRAKFTPSALPTRLVFETIVGETESVESPGVVEFERDGRRYQLQAALEDGKLWFVFRDATSGRTTHDNARQLLADPPDPEGFVTLDFNRARNLPCAYTPFATCPLAPLKNRLSLAVTAGEQKYEPEPAR